MSTAYARVNASSINEKYQAREQEQAKILYEFDKFWNKEKDTTLFANSFGGAYFDESDTLHVNFVSKYANEIQYSFDLDDQIEIEIVDYSIMDLKKAVEVLLGNVNEYLLTRISINDITNSIEVTTKSTIKNLDTILIDLIEIDNIEVEYSVEEIPTLYTYSVTNGDYYTINGFDCTVGFAARNANGDAGFVSAGHCVVGSDSDVGEDIIMNGNTVGDVESYVFEDYSTADAVFVKLRSLIWYNPRWIPSYNLVFNNTYNYLNTSTTYPAVGTVVAYYGDRNHDNILYGEITSNSVAYNMVNQSNGTDAYIIDMVQTDIVTVGGDSGGPFVRTLYIGGGQYLKYVLGVLSGGSDVFSVYSKAGNILDELDLSAY